jgi:hypothetical protein
MAFVGSSVATAMTRWALGVAVVSFAACTGGGGAEPAPVVRTSVQKQCDSLMSAWCDGSLACIETGSSDDELTDAERSDSRELCLDGAKRTCDAALSTGPRYDECRAAVEPLGDADCRAVRADVAAERDPSMPASCAGLFAGSEGGGGTGGDGSSGAGGDASSGRGGG